MPQSRKAIMIEKRRQLHEALDIIIDDAQQHFNEPGKVTLSLEAHVHEGAVFQLHLLDMQDCYVVEETQFLLGSIDPLNIEVAYAVMDFYAQGDIKGVDPQTLAALDDAAVNAIQCIVNSAEFLHRLGQTVVDMQHYFEKEA